MYIGLHVK